MPNNEDFGVHNWAQHITASDVSSFAKSQSKTEAEMASSIASREQRESDIHGSSHSEGERSEESRRDGWFGPDQRTQLTLGRTMSYREAGEISAGLWTLNKHQALALHLPLKFLDEQSQIPSGQPGKQIRQYIGGEGGTGKTQVLHALKDAFRIKGEGYAIEMTASSAIAASKIGGRTVHSAVGLRRDENQERNGKQTASGDDMARWKHKVALVIDEISMLGSTTLVDIDLRLRTLRSDTRPFGGIPIVLFSGDFYQFGPVNDTSVLIRPGTNRYMRNNSDVDRVAKQQKGFYLFKDRGNVVMLRQQVRASSCPQLRGLLNRFRRGEQTEDDYKQLCERAHRPSPWVLGQEDAKMLTPINVERWPQNLASALEWGAAHNKHISLFLSSHDWPKGTSKVSQSDIAAILAHGDNSKIKIPSLLPVGIGMPMMLTMNLHKYLGIVNGAEVEAVCVIPDPKFPGFPLGASTTLHLGPPLAVIIQSPAFDQLEIPGLPPGMACISRSKITITPSMLREVPSGASVVRTGCLITPAFAMTDMKGQGMTTNKLLAQLRGRQKHSGEWDKCDFMSAYVQLSRATSWHAIWLASEPRRQDFLDNKVPEEFAFGVERLERESRDTIREFSEAASTEDDRNWLSWWHSFPESTNQGNPNGGDQPAEFNNEGPMLHLSKFN